MALMGLSGCSLITASPPADKFERLDHQGLKRFDRVSDDVFRGSQPDAAQLKAIVADHHIKTVIKLNSGSDPVLPGVTVVSHPLNAWITPSAETIQGILRSIDKAEKPVYIHCSHGEDRTGLIVALYKVRALHTEPEKAYLDMAAHGFHPYRGVWNAWVREVGWKPGT
jgi:protein tyrosine/serine phosphatase